MGFLISHGECLLNFQDFKTRKFLPTFNEYIVFVVRQVLKYGVAADGEEQAEQFQEILPSCMKSVSGERINEVPLLYSKTPSSFYEPTNARLHSVHRQL